LGGLDIQAVTETQQARRAAIVELVADHLLKAGLAASSLRTLAAACHTSDRMLLYYFADKNDLMVSALRSITLRVGGILLAALPPDTDGDPEAELGLLAGILRGPAMRPYMRLWLELASRAAHGDEPYLTVSGQMADGFAAWIASRLSGPNETVRHAGAARLLATLDGLVILDAVGRSGLVAQALEPCARPPAGP
jgi:AcrR family transcriptional regulator